uniref:Uncharacterized protein n=1 Tax=Strigamia maritima TaxID=126957 RepID=T1JMJ1_STRMM
MSSAHFVDVISFGNMLITITLSHIKRLKINMYQLGIGEESANVNKNQRKYQQKYRQMTAKTAVIGRLHGEPIAPVCKRVFQLQQFVLTLHTLSCKQKTIIDLLFLKINPIIFKTRGNLEDKRKLSHYREKSEKSDIQQWFTEKDGIKTALESLNVIVKTRGKIPIQAMEELFEKFKNNRAILMFLFHECIKNCDLVAIFRCTSGFTNE